MPIGTSIVDSSTFGGDFASSQLRTIPTLDKLNIENGEQRQQCLDFNKDKICEFIVLANGTTVKNPLDNTATTTKATPIEGKCLGLQTNYCKNLLLEDGSVVANPNFIEGALVESSPYAGSTQPGGSKNNNNDDRNDEDDNEDNDNEEAAADSDIDNDSNDNGNDCQSQDDFCDNDEGCESESVDCIDDRGFDEDDYNGQI